MDEPAFKRRKVSCFRCSKSPSSNAYISCRFFNFHILFTPPQNPALFSCCLLAGSRWPPTSISSLHCLRIPLKFGSDTLGEKRICRLWTMKTGVDLWKRLRGSQVQFAKLPFDWQTRRTIRIARRRTEYIPAPRHAASKWDLKVNACVPDVALWHVWNIW